MLSTAINLVTNVTIETLAAVTENLFLNMTLGLLSSQTYTTNAPNSTIVLVSVIRQTNIYSYNQHDLFLAYGLAILAALIAVAFVSFAIYRSGLSYGTSFSAMLRATTDLRLNRLLQAERKWRVGV